MPKLKATPVDLRFADKVRRARAKTGQSYTDLAVEAGLSNGSLVKWVELDHGCTLRTAVALARTLGISLDELMRED